MVLSWQSTVTGTGRGIINNFVWKSYVDLWGKPKQMGMTLSQEQQDAVIKRWYELRGQARGLLIQQEPLRFVIPVNGEWGFINYNRATNVAYLEKYDLQLPTNDMP